MDAPSERRRIASDKPFFYGLVAIAAAYLLLIIALLLADVHYVSLSEIGKALQDEDIQSSVTLTLITCTVTALLSVLVAVPTG
ncbi:MAG: molybdenum ABC transporter permease, partial [Verrucomicrobiaceae bacterium]|nr:molybdenum ABC transporter permease [Verrucomicrobiaceae bacterium]